MLPCIRRFFAKENDDLIYVNATNELEDWKKNIKENYCDKLKNEMWTIKYENSAYYMEANNFGEFSLTIYAKRVNFLECFEECEDDCPICLEKIGGKRHAKTIGCNHHFHIKCLNKYINKQLESNNIACCPLCRGGVNETDLLRIQNIKGRYNSDGDSYSSNEYYSD